jgi:ribosomal protein L7/L12
MAITSLEPTVAPVASRSGSPEALPPAAVSALWKGQIIEAIKLVRLERNIDLKDAKEQVDAYLRQQPVLKKKIEQKQTDTRDGLLRWAAFLLIGGAGLVYLLFD